MSDVTFYLWRLDASTDFMPKRAGQVVVKGTRAEVAPTSEPRIRELVEALATRDTLSLTMESMDARSGAPKIKHLEATVKPGEQNWAYALSEAVGREGGYSVTFTPDPQ